MNETWRLRTFPELNGKGCQCMVESRDGLLYFGVNGGIIQYDGLKWEYFYISEDISNMPVVSLCIASDETIYAGTAKGLFTFKDGVWNKIKINLEFGDANDYPSNKFPIVEFSDKSIWVGARQGAVRIKNGIINLYTSESIYFDLNINEKFNSNIKTLPKFDVYSIFEENSSKIWISLRNGTIYLCTIEPENINSQLIWKIVNKNIRNKYSIFPLINRDKSNRIFIIYGEKDSGIDILENGKWSNFNAKQKFGIDVLENDIIILNDGSVCVGGIGQIFLYKNSQWKMYDRSTIKLPSNRLRLYQTSDNYLWTIGIGNEVVWIDLSYNKWITYEGLNFHAEDKNGDRWFLTDKGTVVRYINQIAKWIEYDLNDNIIDAPVSIMVAKNGEIWIVGSHNHIAATAFYNGKNWQRFTHPNLSWAIDRRAIFEAKDSSLWFGTVSDFIIEKGQKGGLVKYERVTNSAQKRFEFKYYSSDEGLNLFGVYGIGQTNDESIWAGQLGFYRLNHNEDRWEKVNNPSGINQNFVDCIQSNSKGELWVGIRTNGLYRYQSSTKRWTHFSIDSGLVSNSVLDINCDDNGNVWMVSDREISQYDGNDWINDVFPGVFEYARDGINIKFDKERGIWVNQCPSVWQRRAKYLDQYSERYSINFRTIRYHPDNIPPETVITFSMEKIAQPGNVILSWGAIDPWKQTPPELIQFSYRFDDQNWSSYTSKTSQIFTSIPSGKHTFEVRARNRDLNVDLTPAKISFYVAKPLWLEPWFVLLILTFIGVVISYIYHLYTKNKLVQELSETRAQLFTNISHELQTPLTLIIGPLSKVLQSTELKKEFAESLHIMQRNCQRLSRHVNQILDFRKLEVGQMKFEPSKGDIIDFIREECLSFNHELKSQKVNFNFKSEIENLDIWFDPDKIEKIIFNLISNAIKFTPEGKSIRVYISKKIENKHSLIKLDNDRSIKVEEWVEIIIEDEGIGISKSDITKIYDRFYRVKTQKYTTGTGIGLSVVQEMTKIHYGVIEVESELGEGTKFILNIPILDIETVEDIAYSKVIEKSNCIHPIVESEESSSNLSSKKDILGKVLVIDDNADIRKFIKSELSIKFEVMEAFDGEDGFNKILKFGPDLVISDIMMPNIDGIELCRMIKSDTRTSHIAVILLTARTSEEDLIRGLETRADHYLSKPFNIDELVLRVNNIVTYRKNLHEKFSKLLKIEPSAVDITSVDEEFMKRAIKIIEQHMDDSDFSVEMFSNIIGMNRVSLYHKIKSLTSLSTREFFTVIRLKRGAQLLSESGLTVTEIAYNVGFRDPSHFSKLFKKQFGKSPRIFIKESVDSKNMSQSL